MQSFNISAWSANMIEFGDRYFAYAYAKLSDTRPYLAMVRNGNSFLILHNPLII